MAISDIPILSMLRTKMQWHQERQKLLAENVANADTPNFRPRDLTALNFDTPVQRTASLGLSRTDAGHIALLGEDTSFRASGPGGTEIRPAGNAVSLEDEMMKVANNQMDYQAVTTLYSRSLALWKTAIGKG